MKTLKSAQENFLRKIPQTIILLIILFSFAAPASHCVNDLQVFSSTTYFFLNKTCAGSVSLPAQVQKPSGDSPVNDTLTVSPPPPKTGGPSSSSNSSRRSEINQSLTDYISESEFVIIEAAAKRNGCEGDDFLILLAIRKAENGRAGRQFGVMHPDAIDTDLDTQAGWAAATIVKNRSRWELGGRPALEGGGKPDTADASSRADQIEFIKFLGKRYCPPSAHQLNRHWVKNVTWWYEVFKRQATVAQRQSHLCRMGKSRKVAGSSPVGCL